MKFRDYEYSDYEYSKPKKVSKPQQIEITDKMVEQLVNSKIDNKVIFGYVRKNINGGIEICKYNKQTELFVSYDKNDILSKRLKLWREYTGDKVVEYYDEVYDK